MNGTRIAISGKSGCGNTTVSRTVASILGLDFINYTFRAMAVDLGLSFGELLTLAAVDPSYDRRLDSHQVELAMQKDCVIGSRLAIWLLPEASLKVYLKASPGVRAQRIYAREGGDLSKVESFTAERDRQDHVRYLSIYGIDNDDLACADLVINTDLWGAPEVADIIVEAFRKRQISRIPEAQA